MKFPLLDVAVNALMKGFDPSEPRNDQGEWTDGGDSGGDLTDAETAEFNKRDAAVVGHDETLVDLHLQMHEHMQALKKLHKTYGKTIAKATENLDRLDELAEKQGDDPYGRAILDAATEEHGNLQDQLSSWDASHKSLRAALGAG